MLSNKRLVKSTNVFSQIIFNKNKKKYWISQMIWSLNERKNIDWLKVKKGVHKFIKIISQKNYCIKYHKYRKFENPKISLNIIKS